MWRTLPCVLVGSSLACSPAPPTPNPAPSPTAAETVVLSASVPAPPPASASAASTTTTATPPPAPAPKTSALFCHKALYPVEALSCAASAEACQDSLRLSQTPMKSAGESDEKIVATLGSCEAKKPWCYTIPNGGDACTADEKTCAALQKLSGFKGACSERVNPWCIVTKSSNDVCTAGEASCNNMRKARDVADDGPCVAR